MKAFLSALFLVVALLVDLPLQAQLRNPLTVEQIWGHGDPSGTPPQQIQWSPDGGRVTFFSADADLMQVAPGTGVVTTLVGHAKLSDLSAAKDKDSGLTTASYLWAPDSKHLLFESLGQLFLYTLENGTAVDIVSIGQEGEGDPKFSPNGEFLSYVRAHNLHLHRFKDQSEGQLTNTKDETLLNGEVDWVYGEELYASSNYFWAPDSSKIACLQMDESAVPEYPITDWLTVRAAVESQRYPQAGDPNPVVRVGVVKAQGGKTTWIKLPISEGNDYIPRFGWVNPGTLWIETLTRDHRHRSIYFADAQHGDAKLAYTEDDDKYIQDSYDVEFTSSDFYLTSWRDGHSHIYRYGFDRNNPLGSGATLLAHLVNQVTQGDFEVTSVASVQENTQTIYYVSNEGGPLDRQVWFIKTDGSGKRKISVTPGVHSPVFAPLSPTFVDTASERSMPPSSSICHGDDCKSFWKSLPLDGVSIITPESLELVAADGKTTLFGELVLPATKTTGAVPLIVNPYGGPAVETLDASWGDTQDRLWDELLAQHGFAVLHVDNRGMAERGRAFEQTCYRNFGPPQLADQLAAVDQVLAKYPQLDRNRLGWWGWSWGGTFTLYAMTHSDRFRAGVSVAPVTDWRNYDSIYTERYLGQPSDNSAGYHDNSVVNSASSLKGHLLLAQGTGDDNVHFSNTIQFIQKLIDAQVPYDFQVYPRKTHSIAGPESRTHLYSRILTHFETYLKGPREQVSGGASQ